MIRLQCPHCKACLLAPDRLRGQTAKCGTCRRRVSVPGIPPPRNAKVSAPRAGTSAPPRSNRPRAGGFTPRPVPSSPALGGLGMIISFIVVVVGGAFIRTACDGPVRTSNAGGRSTQEAPALKALPEDGVYRPPSYAAANYTDPLHGFFGVRVPSGVTPSVNRSKSRFRIAPGKPHGGETVPASWVTFPFSEDTPVQVTARKTFSKLKDDVQHLDAGLKRLGISVQRKRPVTIDGVPGVEVVGVSRGMQMVMVKYKKHGLDHAITMTCPLSAADETTPKFLAFLRSYRSRPPAS